ncbi:ferritin-like domain-containing protein [Verrucomicrobiaceae bacterium 227]
MNVQKWLDHFAANTSAERIDWGQACSLPEEVRKPLAKSLAVFQLGETGEGCALFRLARSCRDDPGLVRYEEALRAFILEENRHAEILKEMVLRVEGTLLTKQWSDRVFRFVRKLVNLEFELQTLLTAELIAEAYYKLLRRTVDDEPIKQACARIVKDEVGHTGFHAAFFGYRNLSWSPPIRFAWKTCLHALTEVAWRVVWLDHRSCFKALHIEREQFASHVRKARRTWFRRVGKAGQEKRGRVRAMEASVGHSS